MKKLSLLLMMSVSSIAFAKSVYVSVGSDAFQKMDANRKNLSSIESVLFNGMVKHFETTESVLVEIPENRIDDLSHYMHEKFNRCGGFFFYESFDKALAESMAFKQDILFSVPNINRTLEQQIRNSVAIAEELQVRETIQHLSNYRNRYYQSDTGVESQQWVANKWQELTGHLPNAQVELFEHASWRQPSVILTLTGATLPEEIVVIGGHGDSIGGMFSGNRTRAPGADDNASGIATITEVIRVLAATNFIPERTIQFMSYAAEEVGLRGSKEIATAYRNQSKNVVGVLQLDMTNFKGGDVDISFISDFTNEDQNTWVASLNDEFVGVPWDFSPCGYACSDHASWTDQGYPSTFPFEAPANQRNRNIHSRRDTIDISGSNATHALKFSQLAIAYAMALSSGEERF